MMRALSLWQPWASAIAGELKRYETRGRRFTWRGDVAIHATAAFPPDGRELAEREQRDGRLSYNLPRGAIVCVVTLADCQRTEDLRDTLTPYEREWGNYDDGRYALRLTQVRPLTPVPCRGKQGIWLLTADTERLVRERIATWTNSTTTA